LQAEDGIRDRNVTGVQTCALPIYDEDTGITVSDDGSLDLSAFLGGDGGDSDDGPGLDFGDADDDGPELVFGDDEPAVDDDPFASVDESADEPVEEVMPEFDFDAAIAAEEAENAEAEPADEVVHTPEIGRAH